MMWFYYTLNNVIIVERVTDVSGINYGNLRPFKELSSKNTAELNALSLTLESFNRMVYQPPTPPQLWL